ncbi:hypothetical protein E7T06_18335 [Deinococcus sp. Arct2-2]|uniref:hypothetical protein n=1 Tax=Deinococcus sp. Arct2-2 TaxID=2568653 RepID=UPI0010A402E8|nr:hypothetical protein [Deinococcus sp. Arct2-2]THF67999.1 hypothetical protein E7T06_18335 [Deinococcus sp. Arct2-2]
MPRDQTWFELRDRRRDSFERSPWVPLRVEEVSRTGERIHVGFEEEFYGVGSSLFPTAAGDYALTQEWRHLGLSQSFGGYVDRGEYVPSDLQPLDRDGAAGHAVPLVLVANRIGSFSPEWQLHQDFTLTLQLRREGDLWVAPREGYRTAARLLRDADSDPVRLEVAREYLPDYLSARDMGLRLVTFHQRQAVQASDPHFEWLGGRWQEQVSAEDSFEGWITEIHEGNGLPFGERMMIMHAARTDVDPSDDIPEMVGPPTDENTTSTTVTRGLRGQRVYQINGERFRNEWIAPSGLSTRIRHDPEPQHVQFPVDASGVTQVLRQQTGGYWLWFKPSLVPALLNLRDSGLQWYTQDTGSMSPGPEENLHFGVNALGLVNIYGQDVAELPNWLQAILAAHAVPPDGGVSPELLASQVRAEPADTIAPETMLQLSVQALNAATTAVWGVPVMRLNAINTRVLESCHRFRVQTPTDLYVLAKDVTRAVLETLELDLILQHGPPLKPKENKPASRNALQRAVATQIGEEKARLLFGPLAGVYDLRLNDAHHAQEKIDSGLALLKIDLTWPLVDQGAHLLGATALALRDIAQIIHAWKTPQPAPDQSQPNPPALLDA